MTSLLKLIKSRRTIRKFKNEKVSRKIIEDIVEAGRWAPSAHNFQPWKIVIVEDEGKINKIAELLEKKSDELLAGFNIVLRDTAKKIRNSPLLFVVYSTDIMSKKYGKLEEPYDEIVKVFEIQSVASAIENMLLYCHSIGIGAAWYGAALFGTTEINNFLERNNNLMAVLSLGYPDEIPSEPKRKQVLEICEYVE